MPPALISHFINGSSWEHSLPSPAPVCVFSFMLLVGGVCSAHFVFDKFILYWPLNIIIYFGSAIGMMLCVMAEVWLIAKGFILEGAPLRFTVFIKYYALRYWII